MANLALFDFDHTITFNDNFTPFVKRAVDPTTLIIGWIILSPLFLVYKLGIVPATVMRSNVIRFGFRGRRQADVLQSGLKYAREELPKVIRPQALEKIHWHKAQGDVVVVVSASLDVYLIDWCSQLGIELICTELEVQDGFLTGRYRNGDCTGSEKLRRVCERYDFRSYSDIYAYGDSEEDRAMMSIATKKYFRWKEINND